VDAAKGMVARAKENARLSGLADAKIRYIVDDAVKFIKREINRNNKYDIVIMDPPSYGRGPKGEMWQVEDSLYNLIYLCMQVLSDTPSVFMVNSYASDISATAIENILELTVNSKYPGIITSYELGLKQSNSSVILPCGYTIRWESK
jgi:23S rRNA (cytosine1962-C5)-methyltransferase